MNNSNLVSYVEVNIGGKDRLLKYDYNSACDLEELYGKGIAGILQEEQIGFKLVRAFYWAGLKWKEPGLTIVRVGNMLGEEIKENGKSVMELFEPCMDALKKSKLLGSNKDENSKFDSPEEQKETDENESEKDPN
jgi:hypothetical protein